MNYSQLQTAIMDESLRTDLAAKIPLFVERAEGMIARDLRASEMLATLTLTESSRLVPGEGAYRLPADYLEDRGVAIAGAMLRKSSAGAVYAHPGGAPPTMYAISADSTGNTIRVAGVPATDSAILLDYFQRPAALTASTDTNRLLTNHVSIYLDAALFFLYKFTQDLELAQAALDTWSNAKDTLNEQASRFLAGSNSTPRYNIGRFSVGRSY